VSVDDIEQRLQAKAEEPAPESWRPEPGDKIMGRVIRYEKGTTQGWGDAPIVVLESLRTQGRLISVWMFHTTLVNEFKKQRPKVGEALMLEYHGKVEAKGEGQPYHSWRLVIDRANGGGLSLDEAFGEQPAPVATDGAHVTYEPPADWSTTGNADDRAGHNEFVPAGASTGPDFDGADDDIPF
jgi:hypothetical protein